MTYTASNNNQTYCMSSFNLSHNYYYVTNVSRD